MCSASVSHKRKELFFGISSIRFASDSGRYLGFPLLNRRSNRSDFSFIIDHLNQRLANWKGKLLTVIDPWRRIVANGGNQRQQMVVDGASGGN